MQFHNRIPFRRDTVAIPVTGLSGQFHHPADMEIIGNDAAPGGSAAGQLIREEQILPGRGRPVFQNQPFLLGSLTLE